MLSSGRHKSNAHSPSRYYSAAVLAFLHRKMALQELIKLSLGKYVSLERALGSLDLFVLRDRFGDLEDVRWYIAKCQGG